MKFQPKTEAEIQASSQGGFAPWPAGEYDFEVQKAEETTSKAGNDMIKLTLNVFDNAGNRRVCFDYLLASVEYKLRHAAEACGLLADYEQGVLDATDFEGKSGRLKLGVKPATAEFEAGNTVKDYVVARASTTAPARKKVAAMHDDLDDDVPF